MEKMHYIFYDTGVFRPMAADKTGKVYNAIYDSLVSYEPSFKNGLYEIIFPVGSFLEFVGMGKILKRCKLNLGFFEAIVDESNNSPLSKKFYEAFGYAFNFFLQRPELSKETLIKKIDGQLGYSNSPATKEMIEQTVGKYRANLESDELLVRHRIARYLAWNAICDFLCFEKYNFKEGSPANNEKFKKIIEWLLKEFHDRRVDGIDLDSHRLFTLAQQYLDTLNGCPVSETKKAIESDKDLCDANVIHYATFGTIDNDPCIVVTADKSEVIKERIKIQKKIMNFLSGVADSKLNYSPGKIYTTITLYEINNQIDPSDFE